MDVKYINPFLDAFLSVMPQLGFSEVKKQSLVLKEKNIRSNGVMVILGIVGDVKGNVVYSLDVDSAKKIASVMMMGFPVNDFDDMAQSAVSELTNMLTATASMNFANIGTNINISTPTLMFGEDFEMKMNIDKIISVSLTVNNIPIEINIGLENA
ncbi:chemotaxis protein CheX [Desnuesiella massiliensis]|uniref:chemotaxis protein CheX n=1 Tax=Desnuesiella massiliensis TaxID=1650662 RepID=UPI0006E40380|nr:chemotaxis protein CheX [Desnuesiella massiliensis]